MHRITYKDYADRETVLELPAAQIITVLFFIKSLRRAGIEYSHVFWD